MQTDTTTGPLAVYRHAINTAMESIRRHTEEIERICARNTKRADEITALIVRLRDGPRYFEMEKRLDTMSMATMMISSETGDIVDRCVQIREAHTTVGIAMIAFEKAEIPGPKVPTFSDAQRDIVRGYQDGTISEAVWQLAVEREPRIVDLLADYRRFLGVEP